MRPSLLTSFLACLVITATKTRSHPLPPTDSPLVQSVLPPETNTPVMPDLPPSPNSTPTHLVPSPFEPTNSGNQRDQPPTDTTSRPSFQKPYLNPDDPAATQLHQLADALAQYHGAQRKWLYAKQDKAKRYWKRIVQHQLAQFFEQVVRDRESNRTPDHSRGPNHGSPGRQPATEPVEQPATIDLEELSEDEEFQLKFLTFKLEEEETRGRLRMMEERRGLFAQQERDVDDLGRLSGMLGALVGEAVRAKGWDAKAWEEERRRLEVPWKEVGAV